MRRADWRPATIAALGDLFGWWARREAARLASARASNDGASPSVAAEVSSQPRRSV